MSFIVLSLFLHAAAEVRMLSIWSHKIYPDQTGRLSLYLSTRPLAKGTKKQEFCLLQREKYLERYTGSCNKQTKANLLNHLLWRVSYQKQGHIPRQQARVLWDREWWRKNNGDRQRCYPVCTRIQSSVEIGAPSENANSFMMFVFL